MDKIKLKGMLATVCLPQIDLTKDDEKLLIRLNEEDKELDYYLWETTYNFEVPPDEEVDLTDEEIEMLIQEASNSEDGEN